MHIPLITTAARKNTHKIRSGTQPLCHSLAQAGLEACKFAGFYGQRSKAGFADDADLEIAGEAAILASREFLDASGFIKSVERSARIAISMNLLQKLFVLFLSVAPNVSILQASENTKGFRVEKVNLRESRVLKIHVLTVDLKAPGIEVAVAVAPDPDGDGPAESALMDPVDLAKQARLLAAINANPWSMIPEAPPGESPIYKLGGHCDIVGLAVVNRVERSASMPSFGSLWQDHNHPETRLHVRFL